MQSRLRDADFDTALERMELQTGYRYWCGLDRRYGVPSLHDLDPLDIVKILPLVNLVDVATQPDGNYRFRHRLVGTGLVDRFRGEHTGQWFDDLYTSDHLARQLPYYRAAIEDRTPTVGDVSLDVEGTWTLSYRRLILPMTEGDGAVTCLMLIFAFFNGPDRLVLTNDGLPLHQPGRGSRRGTGAAP